MNLQRLSHKAALLLLALTAGIVALYLMRPISDPDFFWHLKTGQWIWEHKALPGIDPFSINPPPAANPRASFILTSYWFAQLIYAALYALGGWWGILLLRLLLVGVMAALFACRCDMRRPANICLLLFFAVQMLEVYPLERPQVFSFVCFAALLILLDRYRAQQGGDVRTALFAAPVAASMMLWSNLHGGFFVGQVTLVLFLVMEGVKFIHPVLRPLPRRHYGGLVLVVLTGLGASLVNPNPLNSFRVLLDIGNSNTFLYTTNMEYFSSLRILREYRDYTVLANWFMMALAACGAIAAIRRPDISWLALLGGTAVMGCLHVRYMPFFLVAAIMFLGTAGDGRVGGVIKALVCAGALIVVFFFVRDETANFRAMLRGEWGVDRMFPVRAADAALQSNLGGPVYNTYLWGGYLIWRLGPERKVFCDNRQLDAARYWEWMNSTVVAGSGEPYWKGLFQKYGIQTAIVRLLDPSSGRMDPLAASLRMDREWALVFAGDNAAVFARTGQTESINAKPQGREGAKKGLK